MKKGALIAITSLFLISFISALRIGYQYFDNSLIVFGIIFFILFAFLHFVFGRTIFKENNATRTIISMGMSLLATYGLYASDFSLGNFSLGGWEIGLALEGILPYLALIILIVAIILLRKRIWILFYILGLLLLGASILELIYQKEVGIIAGIVLIIIGIIIRAKKGKPLSDKKKNRWNKTGRKIGYGMAATASGIGRAGRKTGYLMGSGKRKRRARKEQEALARIQGRMRNKKKIIDARDKQAQRQAKKQTEQYEQQGKEALKNAAMQFKNWAKSQPNPKFVGSWAMFIKYLKNNNWGKNEREIAERLYISRRDLTKIFNRYGKV